MSAHFLIADVFAVAVEPTVKVSKRHGPSRWIVVTVPGVFGVRKLHYYDYELVEIR